MMVLNDLIKVDKQYFKYWEEADVFCVEKIFNFSDQMINKSSIELINDIFLQTDAYTNKYLNTLTLNSSDYISLMKSIINQYLESGLSSLDVVNDFENQDLKQAHQLMFLLMSHASISVFLSLESQSEYSNFFEISLSKKYISETVAKKQRDYGPNNIAKFGIFGLVVRIHDKIARLENLLSSKRSGVNSVSGETIFDTLFDIIGYSTVAIMWINGWFLNPMESDSK